MIVRYNTKAIATIICGLVFLGVSLTPLPWLTGDGYSKTLSIQATQSMSLYLTQRKINNTLSVSQSWEEKCEYIEQLNDDVKTMCSRILLQTVLLSIALGMVSLAIVSIAFLIYIDGFVEKHPTYSIFFNVYLIILLASSAILSIVAIFYWTGFHNLDDLAQLFFFGSYIDSLTYSYGFYFVLMSIVLFLAACVFLLATPIEIKASKEVGIPARAGPQSVYVVHRNQPNIV